VATDSSGKFSGNKEGITFAFL